MNEQRDIRRFVAIMGGYANSVRDGRLAELMHLGNNQRVALALLAAYGSWTPGSAAGRAIFRSLERRGMVREVEGKYRLNY